MTKQSSAVLFDGRTRWRSAILALAVLLAVPGLSGAQESSLLPRSRLSITPFAGLRVGTTASGQLTLSTAESQPVSGTFEESRGTETVVGAQAELRLFGPVSLVAMAAYSRASEITTSDPAAAAAGGAANGYSIAAPEMWLTKAGLSFRLPDPMPDSRSFHPAAFVTAAPAIVWEAHVPGFPGEEAKAVKNYALSFGAEAVTPIGAPWIALYLGVEDFVTFWNTPEREAQTEQLLFQQFGVPIDAKFVYDPSHMLMLRAGLSLRFF